MSKLLIEEIRKIANEAVHASENPSNNNNDIPKEAIKALRHIDGLCVGALIVINATEDIKTITAHIS